jgi:hypothetical protein
MLSSSARDPFHKEVYKGKAGTSKDAAVPLGYKVLREMLKCLTDL